MNALESFWHSVMRLRSIHLMVFYIYGAMPRTGKYLSLYNRQ